MKTRTWLVAPIVLGMAAGLFAFGGGRHGKGPCPRDSSQCPRFAQLTDEQRSFLSEERALRDSMDRAIRSYAESVRKGSDVRSMVSDRAIITDFAQRLERHRQDHLDVWLDLLAHKPGHGPRGKGLRRCPRSPDSLAAPR